MQINHFRDEMIKFHAARLPDQWKIGVVIATPNHPSTLRGVFAATSCPGNVCCGASTISSSIGAGF
jgi:hypothetical protein